MYENEIEGRKTLYLNLDIPSNSYVINFGAYGHTSMVSTPRHRMPHDATQESEESEDGECENGSIYDSRGCGGYRGAEERKEHIASP